MDESLEPLRRRIEDLEIRVNRRLPEAADKATIAHVEVQRMQPQTAAMEQRLEELRQRMDTRIDPGTTQEQAEARRLVDEVRQEHQRIRSRMTAIAWYEERLRRLEERMAAQP